jgi:hypothetical protein
MRRSPLRRVGKGSQRKLAKAADKKLQNYFREKYPNKKCESCLLYPFNVMHHPIEKSLCAGTRYEKENLVFLCKGCHFRHHCAGDINIMDKVKEFRGMKWYNNLKKLRLKRKGWTLEYALAHQNYE